MTDRELLELAAKAAGIEHHGYCTVGFLFVGDGEKGRYDRWNPLVNDHDALRLAVKLNLDILQDPMDGHSNSVEVCANDHEAPYSEESGFMCWSSEERSDDPYAATRRAIVRAAAEIGRMM